MSNGQPVDPNQRVRAYDKAQGYLPYMRELGAMAILAMVLYGAWDIAKTQGEKFIVAYTQQTAAISHLADVQSQILQHLRQQEARNVLPFSPANLQPQPRRSQ